MPVPDPLDAAFALHRQGRLEQAEASYRDFLARNPRHAEALHLLGAVSMQLGKLPAAAEHLAAAAERAAGRPRLLAQVLEKLGQCEKVLGRHAAARERFGALVGLRPDCAAARNWLGEAALRAGDREAAIRAWQEALRLQPDLQPALRGLALACLEAGRVELAIECLERLVRLLPGDATAHCHLGCAHERRGDWTAARAAFARAHELEPGRADALTNLGQVAFFLGEHTTALECLDRATALQPERAGTRTVRGLVRLSLGDWEGGLDDYEHRLSLPQYRRDGLPGTPWRGEDLAGKSILLHAEQGAGDVIQLVRYAPLVAALGAHVVVECQPSLHGLLARSALAPSVVRRGDWLPRCDHHVALASLPHRLGTRAATVPAGVPYLLPPAALPADLERELARAQGKPAVGLVWAGNPEHLRDRQRSLPAAALARVGAGLDAALLGLQKGPREHEVGPRDGVVPLGPLLADFAVTAAVVARLDLVVTVDTAVAHLAGALGKPVWILLGIPEDWRWGRGRDDSAWYPTARLFRQRRPGDWDDVCTRVHAELAEFLGGLGSAAQGSRTSVTGAATSTA